MNWNKERVDKQEALRMLRWHSAAQNVLGACSCLDDYKSRSMTDPTCVWHDSKDDLIAALRAEYLRGTADERAQWALKSAVTSRHV